MRQYCRIFSAMSFFNLQNNGNLSLSEISVRVGVRRVSGTDDIPLPSYKTAGAAGMDLYAAIPAETPLVINPGERAAIPTGICLSLPTGYEAQIRARSGLARNNGIAMVNAPGTIDSDYRGEIQALLINLGTESFTVNRGDRIAQMIVAPVTRVIWDEVESLDETLRGAGGFGHTGVGIEKN
jgi:dUTP pyrophosphatase